jgi:lytic murein transglycosylase
MSQTGTANENCRNSGRFGDWLTGFRQEATAQGLSSHALAALDTVRLDKKVIARDRGQGVFAQDFLTFAGRMVAAYRLKTGAAMLKKYRSLFQQIEQTYGVPGPVITAFWGLETDFGANNGDFPTLTALATLAYDCRRPQLFRTQLMDALRLIDNGDLSAREMRGAWAGELGQVQFLPSDYYHNAVDFDGDGRRDLIRSVPDALASAASLLRRFGWRAGEPWLEEVRVPAELPWQEADVYIQHPRAQWARWGVTRADGAALPADTMPAALLLPMGHNGPAFLAYRNFQVYLEWNASLVYTTTAAYFATRLAGAKRVGTGNGPVDSLGLDETRQLQRYLVQRGFDVGKIDGIIGARTRAAVKQLQLELGLAADSYPTRELLRRLR